MNEYFCSKQEFELSYYFPVFKLIFKIISVAARFVWQWVRLEEVLLSPVRLEARPGHGLAREGFREERFSSIVPRQQWMPDNTTTEVGAVGSGWRMVGVVYCLVVVVVVIMMIVVVVVAMVVVVVIVLVVVVVIVFVVVVVMVIVMIVVMVVMVVIMVVVVAKVVVVGKVLVGVVVRIVITLMVMKMVVVGSMVEIMAMLLVLMVIVVKTMVVIAMNRVTASQPGSTR